MRRILLVGGSPRVPVDAVRWICAHGTGETAVKLGGMLGKSAVAHDILLSIDAAAAPAERYRDRVELEAKLRTWIQKNPDGVVLMSAAINDYRVAAREASTAKKIRSYKAKEKIPSGCDEVVLRLVPESKLVDRLRPEFGLRGAIVAFKYEDRATVVASATALRERVGAALVVANSLCGNVQALVDAKGVASYSNRPELLQQLSSRLVALATGT